MTVKEYLDKLDAAGIKSVEPDRPDFVLTEVWSNNACVGYFLAAAADAGLDQDTTRQVTEQFHQVFDRLTIAEAEELYSNSLLG